MTKVSPTNLLSQVESTNVLRDIKPPVEVPSGWAWLAWVAGALALAALIFWAWKKWGKRVEVRPEMVVPPHIRARHRLRQALMFMDRPQEFCTRVSDAIRAYLEERFELHAPERTTEEFLSELQHSQILSPEQKASLAGFLERCDLVKFARYEPAEAELRELYDAALRLVEQTEPRPDVSAQELAGARSPGSAEPSARSGGEHA